MKYIKDFICNIYTKYLHNYQVVCIICAIARLLTGDRNGADYKYDVFSVTLKMLNAIMFLLCLSLFMFM